MPQILTLVHDEHFDLLRDEDAPEGAESLGSYRVVARDGSEEERQKYRFTAPGAYTTGEISVDPNNMTALLHLVQTIQDRHADNVTAIYSDDAALATKLGALLSADVLDTDPAAVPAEEV